MAGDAHEISRALPWRVGRDAALTRLGDALDQRPVDLPRRAGAEGHGELGGGEARLGDKQQPEVSRSRRWTRRGSCPAVAQRLEHGVEMARQAGTALHRKTRGLVEDEDIVVLVQRDGFEEIAGLGIRIVAGRARLGLLLQAQRRNAHGLPGLEPLLGVARACRSHAARLCGSTRWMWENESPGKRASRKRSTRMPASSAVTATF